MIIFEKTYDGESIVDLESDIFEALNERTDIPIDEYVFIEGTFTIKIEWENN